MYRASNASRTCGINSSLISFPLYFHVTFLVLTLTLFSVFVLAVLSPGLEVTAGRAVEEESGESEL